MKKITGMAGVALLLFTTGCMSAEKQVDKDGTEPFLVPDGPVTAESITNSLKKGRRVRVDFLDFTNGTDTWACPVKVRTVDDVCMLPGYMNMDPAVICRTVGDSASDNSLKKIRWVGESPFMVTFPNLADPPCKNADWDGKTAKTVHVCRIKNQAELNLGAGDAVFLKYDISAPEVDPQNPKCEKLDPYFIVRK